MKILATKKEMAKLIRQCCKEGICGECVLADFCCADDGDERAVEDFCDIVEDLDEKRK